MKRKRKQNKIPLLNESLTNISMQSVNLISIPKMNIILYYKIKRNYTPLFNVPIINIHLSKAYLISITTIISFSIFFNF